MAKIDNTQTQRLCIRIPLQLYQDIKTKTALEQTTVTDYVSKAIRNEVYKDVNITNAQLGALQEIISMNKNLDRKLDLFSNLFIYYIKSFFATHKTELDNPAKQNEDLFRYGEGWKNKFIKNFKIENKNVQSILESVLADYLIEESD